MLCNMAEKQVEQVQRTRPTRPRTRSMGCLLQGECLELEDLVSRLAATDVNNGDKLQETVSRISTDGVDIIMKHKLERRLIMALAYKIILNVGRTGLTMMKVVDTLEALSMKMT